MTPQGLEIDMRLCSQDKMSSVKPYLLQILNAAMQVWTMKYLRIGMLHHFRYAMKNIF